MPKKARITVPKGTKDCNGLECDKNYEFDVEIPETPGVTASVSSNPELHFATTTASPGIPQTVLVQAPPASVEPPKPPEEKKDPHEEMEKSLPTGVNIAKCEGADCGHKKLKNPTQITKFKACPSCNHNGIPKNSDYCDKCGLDEDSKEFEEWEDSELEIKESEEE